MIPLDCDDPVLDGTTGTTAALQYFRESLQFFVFERDTENGCDGLAVAPFDFPSYPDGAVFGIAGWPGIRLGSLLFFAGARGNRPAAFRADSAGLC